MTKKEQYMLLVEVEHHPLLNNDDFMRVLSDEMSEIATKSGLKVVSAGLFIGEMEDIGEGA